MQAGRELRYMDGGREHHVHWTRVAYNDHFNVETTTISEQDLVTQRNHVPA